MLGVVKMGEANGSINVSEEMLLVKGKAVVDAAVAVDAISAVVVLDSAKDATASTAALTVIAIFEIDSFCSLVVDDISVRISFSLICIPVNFFSTFLSNSVLLVVEVEEGEARLILFNLKKTVKIKMAIMAI